LAARCSDVHRRLAVNVRRLAKRRGIAITHLPDAAGVSRAFLFAVLKGESSPTLDWLETLAAGLSVDVLDLLAR
jgi:transcriptional regulator with XRE-family HTH domain